MPTAQLPDTAAPVVSTSPTLAERAAADGVRFLLATFVDLVGKPCSKLVPVESVEMLQTEGVGFAGYAAGLFGQTPADPDVIVLPDPDSYTPLPFVRPGLALVHCDPTVNGAPWPFAPRLILRAVLDRLAAAGYTAQAGGEAEYFLVGRDDDGRIVPADRLDVSSSPCYDARSLTRMYDHLTEVSQALNALGWCNYANDHEDGNGQFEQNFRHADPLTTADRLITFRYLVHVLAERRGMTATFMPKPFTHSTGTGLHLHLSLWDGPTPLFPADVDPRGLGLSPLAYRFVAGLLEHAPALQAVLGPTVNSYKRTAPAAGAHGPSWAPHTVTYGGNDRTHLLRIPEGNRVEVRAGDGAANPYLALAALLAAGLDGVERDLDPGDPPNGPGIGVPPTLLHAAQALTGDAVVRGALDAVGGADVSGYYAAAKREEFLAWHCRVTDAEIEQYLTAF
jgi:glutamine synthetase